MIELWPGQPDVIEPGVEPGQGPERLGPWLQRPPGIVVGNQDTGMRWTHNALKPHYRGWNGTTADHNYNWWDAIHIRRRNLRAQQPGALRRQRPRHAHDGHHRR